jgi:cytochrome c
MSFLSMPKPLAALTWNATTLDRFLAKPLAMLPGTAMTYDGVTDPQQRSDLIAYLKRANQSAECAKPPQ